MSSPRLIAILVLSLALISSKSFAAGGEYPWSDSLRVKTALDSPSLQELLNSFGYSIDVLSDEIELSSFMQQPFATQLELTLKHKGSSSNFDIGWYPKDSPGFRTSVFTAASAISDLVTLPVEVDSIGLYIGPTLYDDIWFTHTPLNWDDFDHAKVFSAGQAGHYVVAFEDLAEGGDQDFQDVILDLRFRDPDALSLSFVGQTYYLFCTEQEICFDVELNGGNGSLSLEQEVNGSFTTVASGVAPLSFQHCFLPWPVDSTHSFVFRVTDEANATITDTFQVQVQFQTNPELTLERDFVDTTICGLDSICLDVASAFDLEGDLIHFTLFESPDAEIDSLTGKICFLPGEFDSSLYQFIIVAYDSCCASFGFPPADPQVLIPCPRDTLTVVVRYNARPVITTIADTTIELCANDPKKICFPISAQLRGLPTPILIECGNGTISDGQLCFNAFTSGVYTHCFAVEDECGGFVRDTVVVTVNIDNVAPIANAGRDSTLTLCSPQQICITAGCTDPTGDIVSCELVSGPGIFDGTKFCFSPTSSGVFEFVIKATDDCGNVDYDTSRVTLTLKNPPVVAVRDTSVSFCLTRQICLPASCSDPDGDISSCLLVSGPGTYNGSNICFVPDTSGTYRFIVRAIDACGASDYDTGYAVVVLNRRPDVVPATVNYTLCEQGQICVPFTASDPDGNPLTYSTTMGSISGTSVCINSGPAGTRVFSYNVIARDPCGLTDTALFTVNVKVNMTPIISVPSPTPVDLCDPLQQCFNVTAVDSIMGKLTYSLLSGPGTINATTGQVCFTPSSEAIYNWSVIVRDSCGKADTGQVSWTINFKDPPQAVIAPPDGDTIVCAGVQIAEVCAALTYSDTPNTTITAEPTNSSVDYTFNYSGGTGTLCFEPLFNVSQTYSFAITRSNECGDEVTTNWSYTVTYDECDSSCVVLQIEKTECVTLGSIVTVDIDYQGQLAIGGYDLLVSYDVSAFSFVTASVGPAISAWEYFTYRLGPFSNCFGSCPSGLVRLVTIADANNGASHPPASQLRPTGSIGRITLRVTENNSFEGQVLPVSFFWMDCGDNAFSTSTGDTLLVDKIIFSPYNDIVWDERDDDNYPESARDIHIGAPDSCLTGDKYMPIRCVELRNGYVCIIDNDSIDARGDINLNGLANEVADAVLYTNYFIKGMAAFTISVPAQTAASDINADGLTLTVGDLIYLLRILVGDANPIPKLTPFSNSVDFGIEESADVTHIWSSSTADIGGVYLRAKLNGVPEADVIASFSAEDLRLEYGVVDDVLNVLLYSDASGARIPSGKSRLLTIDSDVEILHIEAADYHGNQLRSSIGKVVLPDNFVLEQNYPNPFNPRTTISFALPNASDWTLTVLNVNGQIVRRLNGSAQAGTTSVVWDATDQSGAAVATGVYFYRLDAGEYSATRKMILMK